jgi:hypothetical protein
MRIVVITNDTVFSDQHCRLRLNKRLLPSSAQSNPNYPAPPHGTVE